MKTKTIGKLLTISFRLPFRFTTAHSKLVTSPSVGGLATALRSYFDFEAKNAFSSLHWIGISDISKKIFDKTQSPGAIEKGMTYLLVGMNLCPLPGFAV